MKETADQKLVFVPKLRFPDFKNAGEWGHRSLGEFAELIDERVGKRAYTPFSITSGIGLVSQQEKFGRSIAGQQLKNYLVIRNGDFAYNKSATKEYPQGFATMFSGAEPGCVPSSIFSCFRITDAGISKIYVNYLLQGNLHGRWLSRFLTVGARAHGSLNIDDNDLLALPVPLPMGPHATAEQQKIAESLSSLDTLIATEAEKLDALKSHKKGLMQQLFPQGGDASPRLRLPEFRNAPEWITEPLGQVFDTATGGTPDRKKTSFWGGEIPWITTSLVDSNVISSADEFISVDGLKYSSAKIFPKNTVLIAMYGQGKTRGKVALLGIEAATNQACAAILPRQDIDPVYVFLNLASRYEEIRALSNSGGQENLSQGLIGILPFSFPADIKEQRRIAACLSSIDTLVIAQTDKLNTLTKFRKGMVQQLFPSSNGASA